VIQATVLLMASRVVLYGTVATLEAHLTFINE
jgi:hypothetical protein